MRTLIALIILAIALSSPLNAGQTPPGAAAKAIDSYQRAFDWWQANARGENATLTQDDLNLLSDGLGGPPTPEVRAALAKVRPYLDLVRAGGSTKEYGLELDRSKGFELVLPHLSSLRNAARVVRLDAEVRMADGDVRGATEALRAIVGFSEHTRHDGIIISSLVSGAIVGLGDSTIDRALSLGALDSEAANELATALESMRGQDSLHLGEAIRGEAALMRVSVEKALNDKDHSIQELLGMPEGANAEDMTPERVNEQLDTIDKLYGQAADAMANPDREAARAVLLDIENRIKSGEAGPLAQLAMPSLLKAAEGCWRAEDLIAARYRMLDDIRKGRLDASTLANAAYPYLRAAELVSPLEKERQAIIESARVAASALDPSAIASARREIARFREPLRREFAAAAQRERCDFSISRTPRPALVMGYLPGLRGALRIMLADAALGTGPADTGVRGADDPAFTAEEAIAAALRAARHIAADPALGHSLFAASILKDAVAGLEEAINSKRLDPEAIARLRLIACGIAGPDPIGLAKAKDTDRQLLERRLQNREASGADPTKLLKRRSETIGFGLLLQQLLELRPFTQGAPSDSVATFLTSWRSEDALRAALLGIGDVIAPSAIVEACVRIETWSVKNPAGMPTEDSWLDYIDSFEWPSVVDLNIVRDDVAKALSRIDVLLSVPVESNGGNRGNGISGSGGSHGG